MSGRSYCMHISQLVHFDQLYNTTAQNLRCQDFGSNYDSLDLFLGARDAILATSHIENR